MLYAVVLAGGSGTRLWPESRQSKAKQFLSFEADRTLIESTVRRVDPLIPPRNVLVLTGRSMTDQIRRAVPELPPERILAEPVARNTAPCIGWAAVKLLKEDPDATMVVLPSDHLVRPESLFRETLRFAADLVEEDPSRLVTLGIKPTYPSTSYGYIRFRDEIQASKEGLRAHAVERFLEKPPLEQAQEFLRRGGYAWNGGIFIWKARTVFELLQRFEPGIAGPLQGIFDAIGTPDEQAATDRLFPETTKISVDYAVLERAENIVMIEATFDWDDIGTWCSLDRLYADKRDADGNLAIGSKLLAADSKNCVVRGNDPKHLVALLGIEDTIVVQTADATLIARKDREEAVRDVIEELKKRGWDEYL